MEPSKSWEAAAFNRETNEWDKTTLHSYDHNHGVDLAELIVRQATPTIIRTSRSVKPAHRGDTVSLAAGDAQIPFHDEGAMRLFQQAVRATQPDNIVFVGDMLDLPTLSRFQPRPEWLGRTQESIDFYHTFLSQTRANAPNAHIYAITGNHEARLDTYIQRNAAEVLGLRRANAAHELGVLTIPHLCRFDELDVEVIEGYPNGTLWLEDNLKAFHGTNVAKGGSNAAKYLREERETTIYGHTHRHELAYRTFAQRVGSLTIAAASPGCLARTDGSVPGYRHTVGADGQTVRRSEDWQQGLLLVQHTPTTHDIQPVRFQGNTMRLFGREYRDE